jgi:hypothetical protein
MKWYVRKPERLAAEIEVIKQYYPDARIFRDKGKIVIFHKFQGRKACYLTEVIYPDNFPWKEPKIWVREPRIKKGDAPHLWPDGSLCIYGRNDTTSIGGKIILDRAGMWLDAYETWLDTGLWPAI